MEDNILKNKYFSILMILFIILFISTAQTSGLNSQVPKDIKNNLKNPDFDDEDESTLVSVINIEGTHGTPNSSITFGLGYGFVDDEISEKPMILIGCEHSISRRLTLVTENWLLPGVDDSLISYGMRFFG